MATPSPFLLSVERDANVDVDVCAKSGTATSFVPSNAFVSDCDSLGCRPESFSGACTQVDPSSVRRVGSEVEFGSGYGRAQGEGARQHASGFNGQADNTCT
jgi:hypothetical protein